VIDFQILVITLGILLGIVALTTIAAIGNKVYSSREESTKKAFLDRLRQGFLLLRTGIPDDHQEGMRRIVHAFSGRWSELAAEEVSQLELALRLEVIRALEEGGVIGRHLRMARSHMKWTRAHALRILGELKVPSSVPTLLTALEDKDPDVRNVAARSLGRMKLQAAEEALVELLGKTDQSVSARIAAICIEMGPRTAPLLIRSLREGAPKARFWAARILGEIKDTRAIRSLGDALADKEPDVRSSSVWALGMIADRASAGMVEPLLHDPVWYVRAHAAEALGRIGDSTAVSVIADLLQDRNWWVRKNALDALVRIGEPAKPALLKTLHSGDRFARDCAVEALMTLGMPLPETVASDGEETLG
jgi:HEAT repeat protein